MCEHTYWNEPKRDMSFEEFKGIVDQFPKLKWIGLTGIGESFTNKDFMKMLRYVKSKDVFVELYDTFCLIDEKIAKQLIEIEIDKILISFDGTNKEIYEKIRAGSNFERVVNNINSFIRLKKEMKAFFPKLGFHYIINKLNICGIAQYIEFVSRVSRGEKISVQFTRMLHEFPETKDLFVEVPLRIRKDLETKGQELGVPIVWNLDVPQDKPPLTQCIEWTMPFIFVTGHVIPCCSGNEANKRDLQKEMSLGNIFEKPFKEIWLGEKYKSLRKTLYKGKVPVPCRNCCLYSLEGKKS
jgi:MoaA/NifB/PqqE/SkfB family radical SAM enzyme